MEAYFSIIFVFVIASLLGFELINKVPPTLHTPLMSGSNAISGITVKWDPKRPAGQRVREVTFRNKKKLRDKDTYTVAANSYMVSGGSGFSMLPGKPEVGESQGDLEVLELYLKRLPQPVPAPDTNRWQEVK